MPPFLFLLPHLPVYSFMFSFKSMASFLINCHYMHYIYLCTCIFLNIPCYVCAMLFVCMFSEMTM